MHSFNRLLIRQQYLGVSQKKRKHFPPIMLTKLTKNREKH